METTCITVQQIVLACSADWREMDFTTSSGPFRWTSRNHSEHTAGMASGEGGISRILATTYEVTHLSGELKKGVLR